MRRNQEQQSAAVSALQEENASFRARVERLEQMVRRLCELESRPSQAGSARQFPPAVKREGKFEVPDGIIAHLTTVCGGNVHDRRCVEVTSSRAADDDLGHAAKNVADMATKLEFRSAAVASSSDIPHAPNNWICYDFKQRRVVPTHYAVRSYGAGLAHLKSWIVESSLDGVSWREIDSKEGSKALNTPEVTRVFSVSGSSPCRFVRLVNVGRNHFGSSQLSIEAWEIFGGLVEEAADSNLRAAFVFDREPVKARNDEDIRPVPVNRLGPAGPPHGSTITMNHSITCVNQPMKYGVVEHMRSNYAVDGLRYIPRLSNSSRHAPERRQFRVFEHISSTAFSGSARFLDTTS
jgi:hypothetical protein